MEDILDKIDRSGLPLDQQEGFVNWLRERPQLQTSARNALSKGQSIKALVISKSVRSKAEYILRVGA
jgi:hypothetical protein